MSRYGLIGPTRDRSSRGKYGRLPGVGLSRVADILYDFAGNSFATVGVARTLPGYVQNLAGAWTAGSANTLRRSDRGALIEPAATNPIRNNSMQGAVAGTPGTTPTNWTVTIVNGLTREVVGIGTEDGIDYIDIRISGTATATTTQSILMEANTQIAALQGQAWASSAFLKLTAGSTTNVTQFSMRFTERSSGGTALATGSTVVTPTLGGALGLQRKSGLYTLTNASTAFVQPAIAFTPALGAIDFTLRIGWPHWGQGAVASPIRTTNAAVTRDADVATITVPADYSQGTYTFDDNTTSVFAVTPGAFVLPTVANKHIKTLTLRG